MHNRTASLELLRFFAAIAVIFNHYNAFLNVKNSHTDLVAVVVEFFFMLTGFFMMKSLSKDDGKVPRLEAFPYVFKKAKGIFGIYFTSLCFIFIVRMITYKITDVSEILSQLFHFKWEFFMLQMAAFNPDPQFNVDYLSGPAWYISSMLIALIPAYFLASQFRKKYSGVIAPVAMIIIYGYIMQSFGTLDAGNQYIGWVLAGNIRAFAGISGGAFAYFIYETLAEKEFLKLHSTATNVLNILGWASLPCMIILSNWLKAPDMVIYIFIGLLLLVQSYANEGIVSVFFNTHCAGLWTYLGKLSLYVYLFHLGVLMLWQQIVPGFTNLLAHVIFFIIVVGFSMVIMACDNKIKRLVAEKRQAG